ncbi:hypothetical protein [Bacillus cereus group sp. BfR-BA-01380]|uniref:hypothetical protein n=1 Tax=Bacillus cereus group sp. BfR-BA-01380 TaxID=2920324 RepID=UPI0037BFDA23
MVAELYRPGQSVTQLSSEYGVSKLTVCKWIKTYSSITSNRLIPQPPATFSAL